MSDLLNLLAERKSIALWQFMLACAFVGAYMAMVIFLLFANPQRPHRPIAVLSELPAEVVNGYYMNFVLVFSSEVRGHWEIARYCSESSLHRQAGFYDERDYIVEDVTHWMPMPPAP